MFWKQINSNQIEVTSENTGLNQFANEFISWWFSYSSIWKKKSRKFYWNKNKRKKKKIKSLNAESFTNETVEQQDSKNWQNNQFVISICSWKTKPHESHQKMEDWHWHFIVKFANNSLKIEGKISLNVTCQKVKTPFSSSSQINQRQLIWRKKKKHIRRRWWKNTFLGDFS